MRPPIRRISRRRSTNFRWQMGGALVKSSSTTGMSSRCRESTGPQSGRPGFPPPRRWRSQPRLPRRNGVVPERWSFELWFYFSRSLLSVDQPNARIGLDCIRGSMYCWVGLVPWLLTRARKSIKEKAAKYTAPRRMKPHSMLNRRRNTPPLRSACRGQRRLGLFHRCDLVA